MTNQNDITDQTHAEEEPRTIYNIPADNFARFEADIAKLSKKATKLGLSPISPFVFGHHDEKIDGVTQRVYEVMLTADPVKIDGWQFVARLDHSNETGVIIRSVPNSGVDVPENYRHDKPVCHHCNLQRKRRDSYLLFCSATGEYKSVGSTCLADFFGHDPHKIAKLAEWLSHADECARGWSEFQDIALQDRRYVNVHELAGYAALSIRLHGWTSGKAAFENPGLHATRAVALAYMFPPKNHGGFTYLGFPFVKPTDEDRVAGDAALAWAETFAELDHLNDYQHNALVLAGAQTIEFRSAGLLVSIVAMHQRHLGQLAEREAKRQSQKNSVHIGKTGERLRDLKVTVLRHSSRETDLGFTQHIYRFITDDGNVATWFASNNQNLTVGDKAVLTGTVKKHDEYQGVKSTILSRCKVESKVESHAGEGK